MHAEGLCNLQGVQVVRLSSLRMKLLRPIFMQSQKCSLKYGLPGLTVLRRCVNTIFLACMHAISAMLYNFTIAVVSEVDTVLLISTEPVCRPKFAIDLASRSTPP